MTEKSKIQTIIADWKQLKSEPEKKAFLESVKQQVDSKSGSQLLSSAKALKEVVQALHSEVVQPAKHSTSIEVFPVDLEEARLIEGLLSRMGVQYRVA
jgi:superfamily II DNA or RNA helicase